MTEAAPPSEEARLAALSRYEILDTPAEEAFDRITQLASTIFSVPIVLISLVDKDRQWFKSCFGLDTRETDRSLSFCAHAIEADGVMVVPDATQDARFVVNSLVTSEPGIRFYAGAPLQTPDGYKLGTLCLIDREPRLELTQQQRAMLESLAALVVDELELRRVGKALRASEAKLQTSEGKLRAIVEGTPDALYIKDATGHFVFINPAGAEMLGRSVAEVLDKRNSDLFSSEDSARITAADQQVLASGEALAYEQTLHLGGEERIFSTNKFPYRSEQGDLLGVVVVNRNITERKRAERALAESESRYRAIVEQATVGVSQTDLTGRFLYVNDRYCEIVGRSREELVDSLGLHDVTDPEDLTLNLKVFDRLLTDDTPFSIEKRYLRPDGTRVWAGLEVSLVRDTQGMPLYAQAIVQDITKRKRAERALAESEARYRIVAETASDVLVTIDESSTILYLNPAAEKIFGYALEEMLGKSLTMLMPEYLRHVHEAGLKRYRETGRRHISWDAVEVPGLHKDGHEIDLEISFGEHKQEGRHLFTAIIRDITERKKARDALERSTALLQAAFDSTAEGVLSVDEHGHITNYNQRFVEMWRVPKAVLASKSDSAMVQHALKQLREPDGFLERVHEVYKNPEGETKDEFELRDGRIIERVSLPQRAEDRFIGRVWSFRDVTAWYRAEERLQEANRELEAWGEALERTREEERRRLQRDLHDGLGPALGAQTLIVGSARRLLESDPHRVDQLLTWLENDMHGTLEQVRRLVYSLRPPELDQLGLVGALAPKLKEVVGEQVQLELVLPDHAIKFPAAVEVAAYRIVTEAVSNVVRHAQAQSCRVELRVSETALEIIVIDDGKGFTHDRRGVGLGAMRERAEELGGQFWVETGTQTHPGVRVQASLPLFWVERRTRSRNEA